MRSRIHLLPRSLKFQAVVIFALSFAVLPQSGIAQQRNAKPSVSPTQNRQFYLVPQKAPANPEADAVISNQATSGQTIPMWSYTTLAKDGKTYTGTMVGRSPFAHGHRATTIPTYLIPLIFYMEDSGDIFDPTQYDGCAPNYESVISLILNSPLIGKPDFTLNGTHIGVAQYVDAFQRANFWSKVGGTPYHTSFSTSPTVLPGVTISVPPAYGYTQSYLNYGGCQDNGRVDSNWLINQIETVIMPQLASKGVSPANFPQFILDSVAEYENGNPSQCCALGFHDSYTNNGVFQSFSVNEFDTSGAFGGNTGTMSHEIAEWMDDPKGNNPVPPWGKEGQVTTGCQGNLEVGDPLSPNYPTPTNPLYETNNATGVTYTLQELAFYSWFLGPSPSLGAGGYYSDNGTFRGYAKTCPTGGTN